jgi:hypothetical protein
MPITAITSDANELTVTIVGDYTVPVERLWAAYADPRQLEKFRGPVTSVTYFPSVEAMEQLVAMGMMEGLQSALGQLDGVLATMPAA